MSEEQQEWFAPEISRSWNAVRIQGIPLDVGAAPDMGVRFIPVFTSRAEAKAHYPGHRIMVFTAQVEAADE